MNFMKIAKCVINHIKVVSGAQGCKPHCSTTFFIGILGYFHENAKFHQFYAILALLGEILVISLKLMNYQ